MGWVSGIAVYFIVWWIALFLVLPWGVRPVGPEDVAKGHAAGAPARPQMWRRVAATTLLAGVIWFGIYLVIDNGWVSIRPAGPLR